MGSKVLVAGLARSGLSAAKLLLNAGGALVLYDSNTDINKENLLKEFEIYDNNNISIVLGNLDKSDLREVSLCIISPGIPLDSPLVQLLDELKIQIWSEIELSYQLSKGRLIAITGTNGKTTTTSLVGEIVKDYNSNSFVVGNIGLPYANVVNETTEDSIVVLETSSFQLETVIEFAPDVAAILNISEDHLNRHYTMENYALIKEGISAKQTEKDFLVLNYDDQVLREFGNSDRSLAKKVYFSSKEKLENGIYLEKDRIYLSKNNKAEFVLDVKDLKILGVHNYENVMAAIAITLSIGIPLDLIIKVCKEFLGVEHRIEYVATKSGVHYYNDSKATNPDAAIRGIKAMPGNVILIAGGYDKKSDYTEWISYFKNKVKYLILIGQTKDSIALAARKQGFSNIMYASDMEEAVKVCASYADKDDYVLLSPACASFGMFKDFEERGQVFKKIVNKL